MCVGQATSDTVATLSTPLATGDQATAAISRTLGGTAAIVAHNASLLGHLDTVFCGHVGADANGRAALAQLAAAGVTVGTRISTAASPEVIVLVEPGGERTMVADAGTPDWSKLELDLRADDVVFFEGWHLFDAPDAYIELMRAAGATGATVALDVCSAERAADPLVHRKALAAARPDILLANAAEARAFRLDDGLLAPTIVVHAGAEPTSVLRDGVRAVYPLVVRDVLDSTGAGDTFAAGLLSALAAGSSIACAVAAAHRAAAAVLAVSGALLPGRSGSARRFETHLHTDQEHAG